MDLKQKQILDEKEQRTLEALDPEMAELMKDFKQALLSIGGKHVSWEGAETLKHILPIITDPDMVFFTDEPDVILVPGEFADCHGNAARIWKEDPENIAIIVGYALSSDGLWREHTWALNIEEGLIIDSFGKREVYLGIPLFGEGAQAFYEDFA